MLKIITLNGFSRNYQGLFGSKCERIISRLAHRKVLIKKSQKKVSRMKAIVKTSPQIGAELQDIPTPTISADEVLVKVKATSICGTDVHIYNWDRWSEERIKNFPQTMGHEFCGEVVEVGPHTKRIKVGDYISAETHIPCQQCKQCLTGQIHICSQLKILGVDCNGCFAEYVKIPELIAWKNSSTLPLAHASIQEPLGNAIYCTLAEPVAGQSVLVFGDGPIGIMAAKVAMSAGAAPVFLVGLSSYRMNLAKQLGVDFVIDRGAKDWQDIILSETDGIGPDVVLEMAGVQDSVEQGLRLLRKGGRFSAFGVFANPVQVDMNNGVVFKGGRILGINGREMFETWYTLSNMLKYKRLDVSGVITHKLPLAEYEKGFQLMNDKKCGKVVLYPDPSLI